MENEALFHFGVAVAASYFLQALKRWKFVPWFDRNSDKLNRVVAILLAVANTAGINFAMTGSLSAGGAVTLNFPPVLLLLSNIGDAMGSFGMQEIYYRSAIKGAKTNGTGIEGKLREAIDAAIARVKAKEK